MICHYVTIQEQSQTASLKKRKWRIDVSICFQQWHIMDSHYQATRRLLWKEQNLRQENIIISERKIVSGNFLITHHNVMFESWCWLKATAWKWNGMNLPKCISIRQVCGIASGIRHWYIGVMMWCIVNVSWVAECGSAKMNVQEIIVSVVTDFLSMRV
jgi:hypothetical protein